MWNIGFIWGAFNYLKDCIKFYKILQMQKAFFGFSIILP